jgi:hypothetical protein
MDGGGDFTKGSAGLDGGMKSGGDMTGGGFDASGGMQIGAGLFEGIMGQQDAQAAAKAKEFEAQQLVQRAAEERAAGQRRAMERRTATARLISRQIALGAASGAGVTTPSLLDIIGDTEQEGTYHALGDMFVGESRARGNLDQAAAARYQASIARMRGSNALIGGLMKGFGGSMRASGRSGGGMSFSSYYG